MRIYSPQLGRDFSKFSTFLEGIHNQERTAMFAAPALCEERTVPGSITGSKS